MKRKHSYLGIFLTALWFFLAAPVCLALSDDTGLLAQVNGETLDQQGTTFRYDLAYQPQEVEVYLRTDDAAAKITAIDGRKLSQPQRFLEQTYTIPCREGESMNVRATVQAEDGSEQTYTISMTRPETLALGQLTISRNPDGSGAFSPEVVDEGVYALVVPADETVLYIQATAAAGDADMELLPTDYGEKLDEISPGLYRFRIGNDVAPGEGRIFRITLSAGEYTPRSFNLSITRGAYGSGNTALSGIVFRNNYREDNSGLLLYTPAFDPSISQYTLYVPSGSTHITVWPEIPAGNATVMVNGAAWLGPGTYKDLNIAVGEIQVTVTAENLVDSHTYTFKTVMADTATGQAPTLSALSVKNNVTDSASLRLSPAFSADVFSYSAQVNADCSSIYVSVQAANGARAFVNGVESSGGYYSLALNPGNNTFQIYVLGQDYRSSVYTLTVRRGETALQCQVSNQSLRVNGQQTVCAAYNINGNNFFKLRDVACLLSGGPARVAVDYDAANRRILLTSGEDYQKTGGELTPPQAYRNIQPSDQQVTLDGVAVSPTAYNIDGNNYFMLRDLASLLGFAVDYNEAERTVDIRY